MQNSITFLKRDDPPRVVPKLLLVILYFQNITPVILKGGSGALLVQFIKQFSDIVKNIMNFGILACGFKNILEVL
jgi:hypothetical protein